MVALYGTQNIDKYILESSTSSEALPRPFLYIHLFRKKTGVCDNNYICRSKCDENHRNKVKKEKQSNDI
jgi:hypothetical protein